MAEDFQDPVPQPLRGLRVLELAQNLAGPYCGQILHDLGADVIKVERPGGDAARAWGPPFVADHGAIFATANRGKRSIVLDLHEEHDRGVLRQLMEQSDILIEAFRPGAFERLGFGYDVVRSWNPRVLYCSVQAYGETGPLRELPGYDPLMQAHAGLMSVTGPAPGAESRVGTSLVDMGSGMWLAIAVLAALHERAETGRGRRLSVALYDTALAWNAYHLAGLADSGQVPVPMGSQMPMIVPYGAFPAADGEVMIAAANDALFGRLCAALELTGAARDARFRDNPSRVAHREELNAVVAAATAGLQADALLERLRAAGVPCAPIRNMAEVAADPQTLASGMVPGPGAAMPLPLRWSGQRAPAAATVPAVGEHGEQIMQELARRQRTGGAEPPG